MKKFIFLLFVVGCTTNGFTQTFEDKKADAVQPPVGLNTIKLSPAGFAPIINTLDSTYTIETIYSRAKEWLQFTFVNPKDVLKAEVGGNYLRINGYTDNGYTKSYLGMPYTYPISFVIEIEVKPGRYRLTYEITDIWYEGRSAGFKPESYFKEDGTIRKMSKSEVDQLEAKANALNLSLYQYISGKTSAKKNDW